MSKKLMLLAGLLAFQLMPLVSCGVVASSRNIEEKSIKIDIPYTNYSSAYKSIEAIVKGYNHYVEQRNKEGADLLPAETVSWSSDYTGDTQHIKNLLQSGTFNELPSITWNYASLASIVARYERTLEFNGFDTKNIAPGFKEVNTQIQGLNPNKIWVVNTGSSGQVNGVNAPFLAYVVKSFLSVGARLSEDKDQQEFFSAIFKAGQNDRPAVKKVLGATSKDPELLAKIKGYKIDTKRWENFIELLEFSGLIKKAFPKFQGYIVGFDDPNYLILSLLYSDLSFDRTLMPVRVMPKDKDDKDNQQFNFDYLINPGNKANDLLREYFKIFKKYVMERVLWFPPRDNIWGSEFLKQHELLFSVGSTAGYEFCYVASDLLGYKLGTKFYVPNSILIRDLKANHKLLGALTIQNLSNFEASPLSEKQVGYLIKNNRLGSPTISKVFFSEDKDLSPPKGAAKDDVFIPKKFAEELIPLLSEGATIAYDSTKSSPSFKDTDAVKLMKKIPVGSLAGKKERLFTLLNSELEVVGQESTLQASELFAIQPPHRFSDKTPYRTTFVQGPVLVGIKVSDKIDKNALEFVKFYTTNKDWLRTDPNTGETFRMNIVPADYFATSANYVTNLVDRLNGPLPADKVNNSYYKVTFNEFKLGALGKQKMFKVFQPPAAVAMTTIWEVLRYNVAKLTQPEYDFDSFMADLRTQLSQEGR